MEIPRSKSVPVSGSMAESAFYVCMLRAELLRIGMVIGLKGVRCLDCASDTLLGTATCVQRALGMDSKGASE